MRFADLNLARRVEQAELEAGRAATEATARKQLDLDAAWIEVAGGLACFSGADSPITQAVGLGLHGPVAPEELDHVEEFYRSQGAPVNIELSPFADASLVNMLGERGYRVIEFSNVLVRALMLNDEFPTSPRGIEVRPARPDERRLWTETVAQGFAEVAPINDTLLNIMEAFFLRPGTQCFLAQMEGHAAGGAVAAVHRRVAGLFDASTLPQFRRRGVQTTLLAARLSQAAKADCDIAVSIALPGSGSQRNLERFGFRVAYTRAKFFRGWT